MSIYERQAAEYAVVRKNRSRLGLIIVIFIGVITAFLIIRGAVTKPQRDLDKRSDQTLKTASELLRSGDYASSYETASGIDRSYSDYEKAESVKQEAAKGLLEQRLNELWTQGDYEGIIRLAKASDMSDSDVAQIYESAVVEYRNAVLRSSDKALKESGPNKALSVLGTGLSVLPNDPVLTAEKVRYEAYKPVDLTTLPHTGGLLEFHAGQSPTDPYGNKYNSGFYGGVMAGWESTDSNNAVAIFYLNGAYDTLTAIQTVFSTLSGGGEGSITIYGDGVPIYSVTVSGNERPRSISISVSGIDQLRIHMVSYMPFFGGIDSMQVALCDITVQKER